jgi:carboxyl-terminal processing protease
VNPRWLTLVLAVGGLVIGLYLGGHPDKLPGSIRDVFVDDQIDLTSEVLDRVHDDYWKATTSTENANGSARGIIDNLKKTYKDKFSDFYDKKQFGEFNDATSGAYAGVGLGVAGVPQGLRVSQVFKGSPAKEAGIEEGDLITAVNGESLAGIDSTVATGRIKGEPGTAVTITVQSKGEKPRDIRLERATINLPVVDGRILEAGGHKIAYVRMAQFTPDVHLLIRRQMEKLRGEGAEGMVLDLRNNGGGLLDEAVSTSSLFLDEGTTVVSTESRTQGDAVYKADDSELPPQPTVILTNKNTASASEILAAALAENDAATTVGQTTYGKGVFQQVFPLDGGAGLKLTIGEYLTSNGTSIDHKGVVPDVKVPDKPQAKQDLVLKKGRQVLAGELAGESGK